MTREEAIAWFENWLLDYYDIDDMPQELTAELAGIALAALRKQETVTNCHGLKAVEIDQVKKMTNADRIRAMSDEELGEWYCKNRHCGDCDFHTASGCDCMKWLQQTAEEDDHA